MVTPMTVVPPGSGKSAEHLVEAALQVRDKADSMRPGPRPRQDFAAGLRLLSLPVRAILPIARGDIDSLFEYRGTSWGKPVMSGVDTFLADIRENPEDDAARLVFADWLEDNDDPDRAEFIRLQVRLARLSEHDPARFDLEERSQDLLAEHQSRWLSHLPKWARAVELTFRRGLPEEAKMSAAAWLRHGARLAQLVPLQRLQVAFTGYTGQLADVARLTAEVGLTELECSLYYDNTDITAFFAALGATRLRRLDVQHSSREVDLVAALLGWPGLGRLTGLRIDDFSCEPRPVLASSGLGPLEWLDIGQTRNGPAEWAALAANERLVGLRHVELGDLDNGGRGVGRALANARWSQLEDFRLSAWEASADDVRELLAARWASGVRSLVLYLGAVSPQVSRALWQARLPRLDSLTLEARQHSPTWVADLGASDLVSGLASLVLRTEGEGMAALANSPLGRLRRLSLSGDRIGPPDLRTLVDSVRLRSLRELLLWGVGKGAGTGAVLAGCAGLARLRALTLGQMPLDDADYAALAASPHVGALARLNLQGSCVTDSRLTALLGAAWLPSVRELRLPYNEITDRGAEALAGCTALSRLRLLDLHRNPITSAGGAALAGSPHLARMSRLVLPTGCINAKTQDRLRERFGTALVFR
jgi:uncharacterized protein (TIGR02996 family)